MSSFILDLLSTKNKYTTLTFAQSLDAKIAGKHGQQILLSGHESMVMTHHLRTIHDGILIGIGTALNDDPQLNVRHLEPNTHPLPRPIIIDPHLRLSPTCKLIKNYKQNKGKQPWILCPSSSISNPNYQVLLNAGARIVPVTSEDDKIPLHKIIETLQSHSIRSLMIEGGSTVISSFLSSQPPIIDYLIITVAPTFLGDKATGYGVSALVGYECVHTEVLGKDCVFVFVRKE